MRRKSNMPLNGQEFRGKGWKAMATVVPEYPLVVLWVVSDTQAGYCQAVREALPFGVAGPEDELPLPGRGGGFTKWIGDSDTTFAEDPAINGDFCSMILVGLSPPSCGRDPSMTAHLVAHEVSHVADRLAEKIGEMSREPLAYLTGYLVSQGFKFAMANRPGGEVAQVKKKGSKKGGKGC